MAKAKFSMKSLLNDNSGDNRASSKAATFVTRQIPLEQIRPSEKNIYGVRDIEELATTIEAVGLLHSIVVKETAKADVYEIISGERRYRAFQLLRDRGNEKYASIPCKVEIYEDDEISELTLLFANSTARELSDYEKIQQAMRIKELLQNIKGKGNTISGRLREIVAEMLDVSTAQVGRMEKIHADLIPEFKEELKSQDIGIRAAYELSTLSKDEQAQVLEEYKETGTEAIRKATTKETASQAIKKNAEQENQHMASEPLTISSPEQPNQTVERERRTVEPSRANKAQRAILIDFGKEAVRDLYKAKDGEQRAKITGVIEAFTAVADAFGIHDYDAEIHAETK